jgi:hypothetical protein
MPPLSPILLIAAAQALVSTEAIHPHAKDALSERWLPRPDGPDVAGQWHTAFIDWVGFASHYDPRSRQSNWPLTPALDCAQLAEDARTQGVLTEEPVAGDLFLLWSPLLRGFVRSGIIASVDDVVQFEDGTRVYHCITVEGNTSPDFSHQGGDILCHERRLVPSKGDRFIHWVDLDARCAA